MVLLAAAVCTKQGKALVSRQFVEMSRARVEGLLAAFPKLMTGGKQHTFVETESVRYVYQPLERLYMLLITTKSSNILEDLETLRLFSRVIPEYCSSLDEGDVQEHVFELIFAFDEIVALGYRESVNLAQIRTFTEMDSHEEKVFEAMRRSQEKEAKDEMKRRAKELEMTRREERKTGRKAYTGGFGGGGGGGGSSYGGGGGSGYGGGSGRSSAADNPSHETKSYNAAPSRGRKAGGGMVLGKKKKNIDNFVGLIEAEGGVVTSVNAPRQPSSAVAATTQAQALQESVHLKISEKLSLVAGRDGGLQSMEVLGIITLRISDPAVAKLRVNLIRDEQRAVQFQTHPNVDKTLFNDKSVLGLKQPGKPFPSNQDVGVLKWRLATTEVDLMPLTINCWPSENGGKCDVNIEYELMQDYLELQDTVVTIPIPSGVGAPVVGEVDGEYNYDPRKHVLEWRVSVIDASNKTGSMEFSVPGLPGDFFPIKVYFISTKSYCHVEVGGVTDTEGGGAVKYSSDVLFSADKFEIV